MMVAVSFCWAEVSNASAESVHVIDWTPVLRRLHIAEKLGDGDDAAEVQDAASPCICDVQNMSLSPVCFFKISGVAKQFNAATIWQDVVIACHDRDRSNGSWQLRVAPHDHCNLGWPDGRLFPQCMVRSLPNGDRRSFCYFRLERVDLRRSTVE